MLIGEGNKWSGLNFQGAPCKKQCSAHEHQGQNTQDSIKFNSFLFCIAQYHKLQVSLKDLSNLSKYDIPLFVPQWGNFKNHSSAHQSINENKCKTQNSILKTKY